MSLIEGTPELEKAEIIEQSELDTCLQQCDEFIEKELIG